MAIEKSKQYTTRIPVSGGYEILVDRNNYSVVHNTGRVSKDNDIFFDYYSYHGSLEAALIALKKELVRRKIRSEKVRDLDDVISIVTRTNNHFEALIKNAFEGIET